ncbi:hypothetical protein [Streptomyces sp. NBC_00005]|uniref:hypothetical protein n=1 Tax=Streptomyces sp. NBC_00005 TaxID=2903609 RepID=UPI0032494B0B
MSEAPWHVRTLALWHPIRQRMEAAKPKQLRAAFRARAERKVSDAVRREFANVRPATLPLHGIENGARIDIQKRIRWALYREASISAKRAIGEKIYATILKAVLALTLGFIVFVNGWYVLLGIGLWYVGCIPFALLLLAFDWLPKRVAIAALLALVLYIIGGPLVAAVAYFLSPSSLMPETVFGFLEESTARNLGAGIAGAAYFILGCLLVVVIGDIVNSLLGKYLSMQDPASGPYDESISKWAQALRCLVSAAPNWPTRRLVASVNRELSGLAFIVESELSMSWLRPFVPGLFPQLNSEAHRVSECIRQNRNVLLRCGRGAEFERVVESISHGLVSLALGSRERLLDNAPEVAKGTIVKDVIKRMYPGFVFLGAGILLPLIPQIAEQGEVATNVRIAFIVMGVLAIASAPTEAAQKVNDVIAKILPLGKP